MKKKLVSEVLPYGICLIPVAAGIVLIDGAWRWILCIALLVMLIAMICSLVKILREYAPPKDQQNAEDAAWFAEHQNPEMLKKLWRVGIVLDVVAVVLTLCTMLLWGKLVAFLCVSCLGFSVFLAVRYPAYFSLLEDEKGRRERCGASAIFLMLPFWIPVTVVIISFLMRYSFGSWKWFFLTAMVLTFVTGVLLWVIVPELRRRKQHILAALGLALFVSFGLTVSLNYLLDFGPAQTQSAVVAQKTKGTGKSGPSMTVVFSNGQEQSIPVVYDQYYGYEIGDRIRVECHDGGLGIEYYNIP